MSVCPMKFYFMMEILISIFTYLGYVKMRKKLIGRKTPLLVPGGGHANANIDVLDQLIAETKTDLKRSLS